MVSAENVISDKMAHGRSLRATKMVERRPLETAKKNIASVPDEKNTAQKKGRNNGTESLKKYLILSWPIF